MAKKGETIEFKKINKWIDTRIFNASLIAWEKYKKRVKCYGYYWEYVYFDLNIDGEEQKTLKLVKEEYIDEEDRYSYNVVLAKNIKLENNITNELPEDILIVSSEGRVFKSI